MPIPRLFPDSGADVRRMRALRRGGVKLTNWTGLWSIGVLGFQHSTAPLVGRG